MMCTLYKEIKIFLAHVRKLTFELESMHTVTVLSNRSRTLRLVLSAELLKLLSCWDE